MNVILQMYLNENLGDDLFIDIIANRYPNVNFYIWGIGNRTISSVYDNKYKNVHVISANKIIYKLNGIFKVIFRKDIILEKKLKKCDGLVTLGGSVFIDSPIKFEEFKAKVLADVRINTLKIKKPTFVMGANFGPVYHEKFTEKYKYYFSKCEGVCFRDSQSKSLFQDLDNVIASTDIVFSYPEKSIEKQKKSIGISIIDLGDSSHSKIASYQKAYEDKMIEIINEFGKLDYNINLYSFCSKQGDDVVITRIINSCDNKNVNVIEYKDFNINDFIEDFSKNEYIIATRFHSMILGLIQQQKVYPIVYDIKTKNIIDELKLTSYASLDNIEKITIEDILNTQKYSDIKKMAIKANKQFDSFEKYYKL